MDSFSSHMVVNGNNFLLIFMGLLTVIGLSRLLYIKKKQLKKHLFLRDIFVGIVISASAFMLWRVFWFIWRVILHSEISGYPWLAYSPHATFLGVGMMYVGAVYPFWWWFKQKFGDGAGAAAFLTYIFVWLVGAYSTQYFGFLIK